MTSKPSNTPSRPPASIAPTDSVSNLPAAFGTRVSTTLGSRMLCQAVMQSPTAPTTTAPTTVVNTRLNTRQIGGSRQSTLAAGSNATRTMVPWTASRATTTRTTQQQPVGTVGTVGTIGTVASSTLRSIYTTPEDLERATLQSVYHTLTPRERVQQDKWAMTKADWFAPCPADFPWKRCPDPRFPGYVCEGGAHFMSDGILAEGIPSLYVFCGGHEDLVGHDRIPTKEEKVPPRYHGPTRPCGMDRHGKFTYFQRKVDAEMTEAVDPAIKRALGWSF
ncbi:hypothetical protein GGR50DRAFT_691049 [Xylaria sp. CBS 124048]|nr:hypothetical protein GGR50DRAFT_691049 [Xylaria sp. CBS 124048]